MDRSLTARSLRALKWSYVGNGARVVFQFLIGIVLARLLGPGAFGVVAIAWIIVGVGNIFSDFGFGAALIQSKEIDEEHITYIFIAQLCLGAILSITGASVASSIASFFHSSASSPLIAAMSLMFFLQSVGQTSTALLARELHYGLTQAIAGVTYVLAYGIVGVYFAIKGEGAWSLVIAQLTQTSLSSLITLFMKPPPLRFGSVSRPLALFRFGGMSTLSNVLSWSIYNLDNIVVGRIIGPYILGVYTRATNVAATPMAIVSGLQGVLFSASSRVQSDPQRVKRGFLAATAAISLLCFPISLTMAVVPRAVILGAYGEKWVAAIGIFPPLCIAIFINALVALAASVLLATNNARAEVKALFLTLLAMIPTVLFAAELSIASVAWSILLVYSMRCVLLMRALFAALNITLGEYGSTLKAAVFTAVMSAAAAFATSHFLRDILAPALELPLVIASAAAAMAGSVRMLGIRCLDSPLRQLLLDGSYRMPMSLRWWLRV